MGPQNPLFATTTTTTTTIAKGCRDSSLNSSSSSSSSSSTADCNSLEAMAAWEEDGDADGGGGGSAAAFYDPGQCVETFSGAATETTWVGSSGTTTTTTTTTAPPVSFPTGPLSLVTAARAVEKIRVRYETVSKNVNVASLKENFSSALNAAAANGTMGRVTHRAVEDAERQCCMQSSGGGGGGGAWSDASFSAAAASACGPIVDPLAKSSSGPPLTFSSVITSMAPVHGPQVTVAYYFITLLHIANEQGLALSDEPTLRDLNVRKLL